MANSNSILDHIMEISNNNNRPDIIFSKVGIEFKDNKEHIHNKSYKEAIKEATKETIKETLK